MSDRKDRELRDRELGMKRNITRRDFLNGVAVTAGAALMPWHLLAAADGDPEKSPNYYPPARTGQRGSHPGSFDAAHSLRIVIANADADADAGAYAYTDEAINRAWRAVGELKS